jgi:NADPH-dependent glutamate synthase beta subunit-like oxidoreductase
VVWAIKDGREAAASIQQWIEANNTAPAAQEQG